MNYKSEFTHDDADAISTLVQFWAMLEGIDALRAFNYSTQKWEVFDSQGQDLGDLSDIE